MYAATQTAARNTAAGPGLPWSEAARQRSVATAQAATAVPTGTAMRRIRERPERAACLEAGAPACGSSGRSATVRPERVEHAGELPASGLALVDDRERAAEQVALT